MFTLDGETYLTTKELTKQYPYSRDWFQLARHKKVGPPFIRLGKRCFYSATETAKWFKKNMV